MVYTASNVRPILMFLEFPLVKRRSVVEIFWMVATGVGVACFFVAGWVSSSEASKRDAVPKSLFWICCGMVITYSVLVGTYFSGAGNARGILPDFERKLKLGDVFILHGKSKFGNEAIIRVVATDQILAVKFNDEPPKKGVIAQDVAGRIVVLPLEQTMLPQSGGQSLPK